jgi:uncharacterized protein (DUF433 family)
MIEPPRRQDRQGWFYKISLGDLGVLAVQSVFFESCERKHRKEPAMTFQRITVDSAQMDGVPCIRGLRIPVASVVDMIAAGMTTEDILRDFPVMEREDIAEALRYPLHD